MRWFVFLVIVMGVVAAACGGGGADAPVVPVGEATIPTTTSGEVVWEWSMVDLDPAVMGRCASLVEVVWSGSQWVALGFVAPESFAGTCQEVERIALGTGDLWVGKTAVWVSPDGIEWEGVGAWDGWFPMGITVGGPGLVAVGGTWDEGDPARPHPAVWLSIDGEDWWPVEDPVRGSSVGQMFGVAANPDGLVAVGYDCRPGDQDCWAAYGFVNSRPAIWTSTDGTEWTRIPHDPKLFAEHSRIHDVAATPLGWVAVGRHSINPPEDIEGAMFVPESIPVAWVSPDGVNWTALDFPAQTEDDCLPDQAHRVVAIGQRVVITGKCDGPNQYRVPVVWTTDTGSEWTINRFTGKQFGDGFNGVIAATDFGCLMVGGRTSTLVWVSPDGTDWEQTSLGPAMWIGDASAHGSTLLVVGRSNFEARPNQARVWIGTATPK